MSTNPQTKSRPVIGITMGDINGIGPEVILKSLNDHRILNHFTPVIYGHLRLISYYTRVLDMNNLKVTAVKENRINSKFINVVNCIDPKILVEIGKVTKSAGVAAYHILDKATQHLEKGIIDALVTAPINKKNIQSKDFDFVGHTEYFTHKFNANESLMMLVKNNLRVGVVTGHIPISKVSETFNKALLVNKISILEASLRKDFGITKPKIAVLGLNPHAGENGFLGVEEQSIIIPSINEFVSQGKLVYGPFSSDGFFGNGVYNEYDAILAMYHDQGLIPFKLLAFEEGVNFTAGLSVIRTSPDHGTAYDIVGKNIASEMSIRNAMYLACDIIKKRVEYN